MSSICVNCGQQVTNETAHTIAPACDDCRRRWLAVEIDRAVRLLAAHGYRVEGPKGR